MKCPERRIGAIKVGVFCLYPIHRVLPDSKPIAPIGILVSFNHEDNEERVLRICADLDNVGHYVWLDMTELKFDDDWGHTITERILQNSRRSSFLSEHGKATASELADDPRICQLLERMLVGRIWLPPSIEEWRLSTMGSRAPRRGERAGGWMNSFPAFLGSWVLRALARGPSPPISRMNMATALFSPSSPAIFTLRPARRATRRLHLHRRTCHSQPRQAHCPHRRPEPNTQSNNKNSHTNERLVYH